jgi:hypothetical protein
VKQKEYLLYIFSSIRETINFRQLHQDDTVELRSFPTSAELGCTQPIEEKRHDKIRHVTMNYVTQLGLGVANEEVQPR